MVFRDDVPPLVISRREGGRSRWAARRAITSLLARPFSGAATTRTRKPSGPRSSTPGLLDRVWTLIWMTAGPAPLTVAFRSTYFRIPRTDPYLSNSSRSSFRLMT